MDRPARQGPDDGQTSAPGTHVSELGGKLRGGIGSTGFITISWMYLWPYLVSLFLHQVYLWLHGMSCDPIGCTCCPIGCTSFYIRFTCYSMGCPVTLLDVSVAPSGVPVTLVDVLTRGPIGCTTREL